MKYIFNNKEYEKNNRSGRGYGNLIYDIFKYYLEQNQDKTYVQLQNVFNRLHKEFSGEKSKKRVIFNKKDFLSWLNDTNNKDNDRSKRYFGYGNYGEPLKYNGEELYFTTQWGNKDGDYGNINRFVDFAIGELDYKVEKIDEIVQTNNDFNKKDDLFKTKNIMLYGAPGVGKTHNYQKLISMIENNYSEKEIFNSIRDNEEIELESKEFQKIKDEKRVEFVTFHQSYSYEDFIEGFRPSENTHIELEDGIFKTFCNKAKNQAKETSLQHISFDEAFDILRIEYIENELEKIYSVSNIEILIHEFKEKTIKVQSSNAKDHQYVKKNDLEAVVQGILDGKVKKPRDIKSLDVKKDTISLGGLYYPIGKKVVKIIEKTRNIVEEKEKNFYIVIDEINRGNISKIFGELITLIEEDKRDIYEVTLPYSKEKFKIPSNLYIIATMNSTDKSIATIDIALRRRFTFLKMKPNEKLVEYEDAKTLMNSLNIFIGNTLGEDYKLGHSYFMKVKNDEDLKFIIEYKIKPLLEEYFYADEENYNEILTLLNKKEEKKN